MELIIGILCGVILSLLFSFGPAFFGLIQSSVQYGFKKAFAYAVGVSLSDVVVVALMLTVLKNADMASVMHNPYVAAICGVVMILMGVVTFRKRRRPAKKDKNCNWATNIGDERRWKIMLDGFLLNIFNPFVWIYWITIITFLSAEVELDYSQRYVFFGGMLLAALLCDLLKCRLASFLQRWFTERRLAVFNRMTGVVLIAFGVYMVCAMVAYQSKKDDAETPTTTQSTRIIRQIHEKTVAHGRGGRS